MALKGLADFSGSTKEAYDGYLKASYWLSDGDDEGECLLGAMKVAEALAGADTKDEWRQKAKTLREQITLRWPNKLGDDKPAKAEKAGAGEKTK